MIAQANGWRTAMARRSSLTRTPRLCEAQSRCRYWLQAAYALRCDQLQDDLLKRSSGSLQAIETVEHRARQPYLTARRARWSSFEQPVDREHETWAWPLPVRTLIRAKRGKPGPGTESSDVWIPRQGHCAVTRVERQEKEVPRCNETTTESPAKNRPRTAPGGQSLRRWRKRAEGRQRGS